MNHAFKAATASYCTGIMSSEHAAAAEHTLAPNALS
jgi:hypothetical protein